ncbi:non-hydrolyzing UDP-N-acetylglucosamine 2-epimerase [Pediococcus claussenii]|uniref:UDP-N-acetylglucosamine 2-epimerase (non-hydrolyzing) n=1 Tax=Pediococcus claussenii (strain ATCC BAA-344 / DSM 14800 / JCM 18046 / KCTC 3811 / LMG 21948 / P06) TaxID=701521 RepID=G8PDY6_PEDCP|nr:UDP-N-acetylglucosamine 2-epimerase (non-hydrolyzing) [Pediococcus claussenii]AEV95471.1 UDP-N-acetylglucosamine 2-epimerase [Pediococcus claussenii ATCC BAA-344]ANZ68996.1 UDP-N-acetyl glucosamine 2-epimerase [Pediococcus claussenii]ANZ70812.1 UDP-N-acetyl glucosamine 2-epimerase [Pediococcus claussenii]
MDKIKVLSIFGTRPEAIKMAPVVRAMQQDDRFLPITVVTGQHREMLDQVLKIFKIVPEYDLNVMGKGQTLSTITNKVIIGLDTILENEQPNLVLVHGDTTTTFAAALSAFYHQIAIGHVEAGLRTWNKYSPFPEEMNRQMVDDLTDFYFAPTSQSAENLRKENHASEKITVTGNTAIDALKMTVQDDYQNPELNEIFDKGNKVVLVTMHRRENQGEPMQRVFRAVRKVIDQHEGVEVVFPVHLNPKIQEMAQKELGNDSRIHLIKPLDVIDFHNAIARSYFVMTDSGGVQEEAPALNKPVLVLRDTTERPEGITAGTLKLVGTEPQDVTNAMIELLENQSIYKKMASAKNPYGDGDASLKILDEIAKSIKR